MRILCGHDWSLCAPPIESSAACPGLRPLHDVRCGSSRRRHGGVVVQVVCVVQAESTALVLELFGRETLERSLCGYGHEDGEGHGAVGQMQRCSTRLGDLACIW